MLRTTSNFVRNGFSPYQERLISGKPCPKSGWKTRATLCNIEYVNKSAIAKLSLQMQMNRYHLFTYTAVLFLIFQLIKQYKEGLSSLPEGDFIIDASPRKGIEGERGRNTRAQRRFIRAISHTSRMARPCSVRRQCTIKHIAAVYKPELGASFGRMLVVLTLLSK